MAVGAYQAMLPRDPLILIEGTRFYPEAASQTFLRGTPVILDANGRIAAAGASPALLFGVALDPGHNAAAGAQSIAVLPFRVGQEWQISLLEALAQNQMGLAGGDAGIVKDATTGYWYISTADAGAQFRVVDYLQGPAGFNIGDTKATVYAVIHSTKLQVF